MHIYRNNQWDKCWADIGTSGEAISPGAERLVWKPYFLYRVCGGRQARAAWHSEVIARTYSWISMLG